MLYKTYSDEYFVIIAQKSKVPGWGLIGYKQTDHINTREKGRDAGEAALKEGGRARGERSCDRMRDSPAK